MKMKIPTKSGHTVKDLTRKKAIRHRCINCSGFFTPDVKNCTMTECHLYPYRMWGTVKHNISRAVSIRKYCLYCCAGQHPEVTKCPSHDCSLWPYRKFATDRSMEIKD